MQLACRCTSCCCSLIVRHPQHLRTPRCSGLHTSPPTWLRELFETCRLVLSLSLPAWRLSCPAYLSATLWRLLQHKKQETNHQAVARNSETSQIQAPMARFTRSYRGEGTYSRENGIGYTAQDVVCYLMSHNIHGTTYMPDRTRVVSAWDLATSSAKGWCMVSS